MTLALPAVPSRALTLAAALEDFLAAASCAPATKIAHQENARALVRKFGDRPIADFRGRAGGRLLAAFLAVETGSRRRRPPGGRRGPIGYGTARARLGTLRKALELAVERGALARMPEPWPIPRPGAEGHLERGRYVLREEAEALRATYPPRARRAPETSTCPIPASALEPGALTLGAALEWLVSGGVRRRTAATQGMRAEHVGHLVRFFGRERPLADFQGPPGYQLLLSFVAGEGPEAGGRGVRFCTLRKRLNTLSLALKEGVKRGALAALPPWPELPADSLPRERWLTVDEYEALRAALAPRWRVWLDLGVWTGQHSADVDTMTWGMVDLGAGPGAGPGPGAAFFMRRNTKNRRRPEWLPMPDGLRRRLADQWALDRRNGAPPPTSDACIAGRWHAARRTLRKACFKLGFAPVAPIDLRRTAATWWIDAGGPKDGLRKYLGHSASSAMVDRHYAKVTPDMLAGGVAALDRHARRRASAETSAAPVPMLPAKEDNHG
jgi:integrase